MNVTSLRDILVSLFKKRRRRTLYLGAGLFFALILVHTLSPMYLEEVPAEGGSFSEGLVGYPRFVNPVLAISQTDRDISRLVFSGLFTNNAQGETTPDLALGYESNASSTEYTVTLRDDIYFHDGEPITTADVDFTYSLIVDPIVKSHLAPQFDGVSWEVVDERTIVFSLRSPNPFFVKLLNTGILSRAQWADTPLEEFPFSSYNISPIGSGPYQIESINRNKEERIVSYVLTAHDGNRSPLISTIEIKFYNSQDAAISAFESGLISNLANISPQELLMLDHTLEKKQVASYPLDRSFVLFFNSDRQPLFENTTIRKAIDQAIDKEQILDEVLFNRGDIATGPLPLSHPYYTAPEEEEALSQEDIEEAFADEDWTKNEQGIYTQASSTLVLTLHVPDIGEITRSAEIIEQNLEAMGIGIEVVAVDQNNIVNDVVRRRDYEMLIFGQLAENPNSLHAFWHSSNREDPGINIAGYDNQTVDVILERLLSGERTGEDSIEADYSNLQREIREDTPAVFLYHPHFIYAYDRKINNINMSNLRFAWDRFNEVEDWYIQTERLLPWFTK